MDAPKVKRKWTRKVPIQMPTMQQENVAQVYSPFEKKLDTAIELLSKVVDKLDRQFEGRISSVPVETPIAPKPTPPVMPIHIPFEYRMMVDEMLNRNFQIEIEPLSDSPAFKFIVVVPEKYSSLSEEYKKMYKRDERMKVVTYSEGTVGVRAYLEKVWTSFNPTIQALIVSDRN